VHQLDIKVLNIIDARCNHEVCGSIYCISGKFNFMLEGETMKGDVLGTYL